MKKLIIGVCCVIGAVCLSLLSACDLFGNKQPEEPTYGKIGETLINSDNVSICVVNCENTKQLGSGILADTTENNFILLTIKVTNNSNNQQTFSGSCTDLYNSKNIKYEYKTSLNIDDIISEDIGVGISKTFQVVFETPTTTNEEEYIAKIGYSRFTADSNRVTFSLKTEFNSNENADNKNNEKFSQYFIEDCPIKFTDNSIILNNSDMQLIFVNNSDKKIIAYEAIFILYNVYGEKLIYSWNTSPYNKIAESPTHFEIGSTDLHYYSINSKVSYAEVYIYYVLFDDQTSWGCRTDIPAEKVIELGTKFKIER